MLVTCSKAERCKRNYIPNVRLYSRVPVETTKAVVGSQVPGLGDEITIGQDCEYGENGSQIGAHVEAPSGGIENLAKVDCSLLVTDR